MTRINTNISSMIAQNNLAKSNKSLATSLERLSTGLRINRGADNPSGLIVSERLRSEIRGVDQAISNAERAINVISTTEAALEEVASLLVDMKSLAVEAANTGAFSEDEIRANQLQIDSAIESITRISNTTSFAGLKLLNGSLDYITSGVTATELRDVRVHSATFGSNSSVPVSVEVLDSAETAQLFISGNTNPASPGTLLSSVTFEVRGPEGVEVFDFVSGTTTSAIVQAINMTKDATGVSASLVSATDISSGLVLTSTTYGSDAFVSVEKRDQTKGAFFNTYDSQGGSVVARDEGEDVLALINGNLALGNGLNLSMRTTTLNIEMKVTEAFNQAATTSTFDITGGGARYQIGPQVNVQQQVSFGVQSVAASRLGSDITGYLSSVKTGGDNALTKGNNPADQAAAAAAVLDEAIDQISTLRGRLGAFQRNTLETSVRSQQIALENLTSSESSIRDTDFAEETANLTRNQILTNAGTSVLAIANSTSQSVLSLLG